MPEKRFQIDTRRMQPADSNPFVTLFLAFVAVAGLSTYGYAIYRLIAEVFPL